MKGQLELSDLNGKQGSVTTRVRTSSIDVADNSPVTLSNQNNKSPLHNLPKKQFKEPDVASFGFNSKERKKELILDSEPSEMVVN